MPSIDERVVAMSFENSVFETRVSTTLTTLDKLDRALKNMGAGGSGFDKIEAQANKVTLAAPMSALDKLKSKLGGAGSGASEGMGEIERASSKVTFSGAINAVDKLQTKMGQIHAGESFGEIEGAASKVTLSGLVSAIENAAGKFSVLEGAASVAFGNIASQAAMKGASFAKSFAVGPVVDGFKEYSTNLNSIQTILANTKASGADLDDVNGALQELNTYSDQTIYNFSQMANSIGLFTAAGVDLKTSVSSIKGLANLAALSGSDNEKATHAMQQLSQAIAAGKVTMQDWISVRNAGMGGTVFQRALAQTAEAMGTLDKGSVKLSGSMKNASINGQSFAESIQAKPGKTPWLTSKVLTTTLAGMTGDLTDAQLAAQGFNGEQIKSIQETARAAKLAATEVRTLPQAFDVAKETIGSGWSSTFQTIFGDFEESKKSFTAFSNGMNAIINANATARNKVLKGWHDLGGRAQLFQGLENAIKGIGTILKPIQDAFREVFPPTTAKELLDMTKAFAGFAKSIAIDPSTADNIKRTFAGIFAVFDIAKRIVGGVVGVIVDLIGVVGKGSGGFLSFTGGVGDFLVAVDQAIAKGKAFKGFFEAIGAILAVPLHLLGALGGAIANLFGGGHEDAAKGFESSLDGLNAKLGPFKTIVDKIGEGWDKLVTLFGQAREALEPWLSQMAEKLKGFGTILADAFKDLDFDKIMSALETGFIGGIFLTLKKALGDGLPSIFGDAFGGVNDLLKGFTGNLEAMQKNIKADTLLKIAAAIAVLAGGIFILSKINGKDLSRAMTAVAVGLGELMGAMKIMTTGTGKLGILQLPVIAASMIGLAIAVTILSGAVKIFSTMSWEDIGKGLAGVAGSITAIALGMKLMPATLPLTAVGLVLIGVALNVIAVAMQQFGSMDMVSIAKGVFAMVEALGGIALGVSMMPPTLPLTAAGLILMGVALVAIGGAIKAMGSMDFLTILKGLGAMMAAIAGIGLAISLVPPTIGLTALGLLVVGQAMVVTAGAIALLGKLSIGTLLKGLVGLAGALIILAGGLTLMIATLPGAAALMVAAGALAVLVPVLGILGTMKWSTIFKGLAAMALIMLTIGTAGLIAAPALAAIGIALIPLGLGFLLVATAAKMFASAIALLSDEGQKGFGIFLAALTGFVALVPNLIISFVKGLLDIVDEVTQLAPKIVIALGVIIDTIIAFVIQSAPKLAIGIGVLVDSIIQVLLENSPKLINAGVKLLGDLLNGISSNINAITDKVSEIIVKFLGALDRNMPKLIDAGTKVLKSFLNGISSKFGELGQTVDTMINRFGQAVANHAVNMVKIAGDMMLKFISGIAQYIPQVIDRAAGIILAFISGLGRNINKIVSKGADVIIAFIDGIGNNMKKIADKGADAVIKFLNGMAETIRTKGPELKQAGWNVADALIDGIWGGFDDLGHKIVDKLGQLVKLLPKAAKKLLGISSPSSVFQEIGRFTMLGFQSGIEKSSGAVSKSAEDNFGDRGFLGKIRDLFGIHSPSDVMREIGMQVNRGFADGLKGSADEVASAFSSLNDKLRDNIRDEKSQIAEGHKKIEDLQQQHADKLAEITRLQGEKKPDKQAIADAQKEISDIEKQIRDESVAVTENESVLRRNRAARQELVVGLRDEKNQLLGLKAEYDDVTKKLEAATSELEAATRARDDAQKSYTDKYSASPDISGLVSDELARQQMTAEERLEADRKAKEAAEKQRKIDQVALYKKALAEQLAAEQKYNETLQKLRALGLDDTTYKKLLEQGTAGQEFASQLLTGGKAAVDGINALDAQVLAASTTLAQNAATNLYQAGVDAAQGLVNGLAARKGELEKQMEDLAAAMVNAIKKKLKIKSPSQIFAEIADFAGQGLAVGLKNSAGLVADAASTLGSAAISAVQDSIAGISSAISDGIDAEPVITPVLDLSNVKKGAEELDGLSNVVPISAAASFGQASAISVEKLSADAAAAEAAANGTTVKFEQNNYSPESLSEIEIYRQTNNQLAQLKSLVGVK